MTAIISLLLVLAVSMVATRIATIALTHTGLSRESARFQARSALTGTGFTTSESERVVSHPVRRRIIMVLMLLGNAGIVAVISSLVLGFVGEESGTSLTVKVVMLVVGIVGLWGLASSTWVDQRLSRLIESALKRYTKLDVMDYASLLHVAGDYKVIELYVREGDWMAEKSLRDLGLMAEGLLVLGVDRSDGLFVGAPNGDTILHAGDDVIIYGRDTTLAELDRRPRGVRGDIEHVKEVVQQERVQAAEKRLDSED